ncbi:MAG: phospholipase D family protein [Luminiphilus sp.]|nr:phospholipase D family protein [Luminiphilus sp.]
MQAVSVQRDRRTALTKRCLVLLFTILLAGCAAAPQMADKPASYFDDGGSVGTPLAALVGQHAGSGVSLLADPDDALQSRLHLAALAGVSLDLQYYLWQGDDSGMALTHEVLLAADRGVRVRILLDDIYHSGRDSAYQTLDAHPNVEVRLFNPMGNRGAAKTGNYALNKSTLNYRMHNKIFLVDGVAAVMGGRNIGDEYFGRNPSFNFQDMDAIAVGPVAAEAGSAFDLFWNAGLSIPVSALGKGVTDIADPTQLAQLADARERIRPVGERGEDNRQVTQRWLESLTQDLHWTDARIIVDRPDRGNDYPDSAFTTFSQDPEARPEASVVIQTAYLIPNGPTLGNLQSFSADGVTIRILTNSAESTNHNSVHAYYAPYRKKLLAAGVELYEVQGSGALAAYLDRTGEDAHAGLHTKAMVIDERISVIGSYNMDPRSRVWNSEIALVVEDPDFAAEVLREMDRDFSADAAWQLSLDDSEALVWSGRSEGEWIQVFKDPGSSWWDRFLWRIMRVLPLENEL